MLRVNKLVLFVGLISSIEAFAQKMEVGLGIGPTFYKGDLQPTFRPFNPGAAGNAFFRYNVSKSISLKANGNVRNCNWRR